MAAVVAGRVSVQPVLAMGQWAIRFACGGPRAAAIVTGIVFTSGGRRKNGPAVALHASADHAIVRARKLRVGWVPQRMRVDYGRQPLVGFRHGGHNSDNRG